MNTKLDLDPRLDPRIKAAFAGMPVGAPQPNVTSREELLAQELSPEGRAAYVRQVAIFDSMDREDIAPSTGLVVRDLSFISAPDGNRVKIQYIRPEGDQILPCVYYIHGGRMMFSSCYEGNYKAWGRMIAARGLAVAMVDFRNAVHADSAPEIAPFPAGLDDCVSGLRWVHENAAELNIDPSRIVVTGESGGGNLALATAMTLMRNGDLGLIKGIYAMCPFIAGDWPQARFPSSTENEGIFISVQNNRTAMAYGIEALKDRNPLAWPSFATVDDVKGLPPVVISVNECDPLRDEGIAFYRLLMQAGVAARCRQLMGACHAIEVLPTVCPDLARSTAGDIADFAKS